MAGFYVDLGDDGTTVLSPTAIEAGAIADDLQNAAQVVEILFIKDHTRMKHVGQMPYDSAHEQQQRLLPLSHPEEWATASESFRPGDYFKGPEA